MNVIQSATVRTPFGVYVLLLTGDTVRTARAGAIKLGIANLQAGVIPQDSHEQLKLLKAKGHIVGTLLNPIFAGVPMSLSSVSVLFNALRPRSPQL